MTAGGSTTVRAVFNNGTGSIDQGIGSIQSGLSVSTGPLAADRTFTLTVRNSDGKIVTSQLTVHAVPAPVIDGFTATPDVVVPGQAVTLMWSVSGAATLKMDHGVGTVSGTSTVVTASTMTTYTLTATNAAGSTTSATALVNVVVSGLPRIHVDRSGATAVFRDPDGRRFIPRGSSYVRLNWSEGGHHSTFQPGLYSSSTVETALSTMEHFGYNIVRVFIDHGENSRSTGINGAWATPGLDPAYMTNVSDFLLRATQHHIYVLFALEYLPFNQHYTALMSPSNPGMSGSNTFWLDGPAMQAKKAFVTDLVDGFAIRLGAGLLSTVFAYELESEMFYEGNRLPFSSVTGSVTTADGATYSLADPAEREAAADNNMVFYANLLTDAIKARDPGAMTTLGAFTYHAVGKPGPAGLPVPGAAEDQRFAIRISMLPAKSRLDFIDLHTYPLGPGYTLADDLASSEWSALPPSCPVLMGEFGAFNMFYPDVNVAAALMRDHQIEAWNRGFAGFLFWTYDTDDQPWPRLWTLMDANGAINQVLAPLYRPDPSSPNPVKFTTLSESAQIPASDPPANPRTPAIPSSSTSKERRTPNLP
ncbi:MAG TPA: hypothetical protein VLT83_01725 [Opitutaceae bacterium]|nr:hypothetical protein [Opitutaceae bacterium]